MKLAIDWSQPSTLRGAIWVIGGVLGVLFSFLGKDPMQIMSVTAAVAGGLGVAISDKD